MGTFDNTTSAMSALSAVLAAQQHLLKNDAPAYRQFVEIDSFKRFIGDMVYAITS